MSLLEDWKKQGDFKEVNGHRVFYIDTGSPKPILCILHGFPTSSLDYVKALELLSAHFRVVVHDHLGFGFSDKPADYSYSLIEQAEVAMLLWRQLGIDSCYVLAHDYGTSLATELMHRDCEGWLNMDIKGYLLSNGSMHIELAQLRPIQKLLRSKTFGPLVAKLLGFGSFRRNIKAIFTDESKISESQLEAHWQQMIEQDGRQRLPMISRYSLERWTFWHRWIGALQRIQKPIDIIWADSDPIAVAAIAETLHSETSNSTLKWIESCGHFPMIEKPEDWSDAVIQSLSVREEMAKSA
ncbi:alpha/beta fold hydrolase [Pleionea sp. CnH1-48]|uniref:alpha/beta fold hydrolase n=1 Tax=Pleionea sp. CnH1-48 TaxID=2954494 RepID=UPI002096F280|nr:alpha/beta hydrolase [Pleionea sp. CnH1-48]MCO7226862.1 alpha/beta hydrolase [Pleionea sp. CnH1-48]